jgi:hypothetical protein
MLLKKDKKNAQFEGEYIDVIPSRDEMNYIGKVSKDCYYFYKGILECRREILNLYKNNPKTDYDKSFVPCIPVTEKYYECTTHKKFGNKLIDMDPEAQGYFKNFSKCFFGDLKSLDDCRKYYDDVLRFYFRTPDSPLKKIY